MPARLVVVNVLSPVLGHDDYYCQQALHVFFKKHMDLFRQNHDNIGVRGCQKGGKRTHPLCPPPLVREGEEKERGVLPLLDTPCGGERYGNLRGASAPFGGTTTCGGWGKRWG
jgi:hypothetical protein